MIFFLYVLCTSCVHCCLFANLTYAMYILVSCKIQVLFSEIENDSRLGLEVFDACK